MGLDMYLSKKTYVKQWSHTPPEDLYTVDVLRGGKPVPGIKPERISYITEKVAYWRKANEIHKWFVDNVQSGEDECKPHQVSHRKLNELLKICKNVVENPDLAPELLPTQEGFFFGSTEYDEYYFNELKETITMLEAIVSEEDADLVEYEYQSSW